jgi:opacity protein-like surface antigen
MKKSIVYIFCLFMLSLSALAQIPKGSSMIGGSISGSYQKATPTYGDAERTTSIDLRPNYGLFVINNLCVGIGAGFGFSKVVRETQGYTPEATDKTTTLSVGPFVRYYVPITQKLYAFADASYGWNWVHFDSNHRDNSLGQGAMTKERTSTWGLGAGISYFMTPNAALELGLGYTHDHRKETETDFPPASNDKTGTLGLSIGFNIFLRKAG